MSSAQGALTGTFAFLVFGGLFLGFAVVPMFPVHSGSPTPTAAPTVSSVLLAAILLSSWLRLPDLAAHLPQEAERWARRGHPGGDRDHLPRWLSRPDRHEAAHRLLSIGHMGFVMLGIATLTDVGINASVIGMVAHGLITGCCSSRGHPPPVPQGTWPPRREPELMRCSAASSPSPRWLAGSPNLAGFGQSSCHWWRHTTRFPSPLRVFRTPWSGAIGTVLTTRYMLMLCEGEPRQPSEWAARLRRRPLRGHGWVPLIIPRAGDRLLRR